MQPVYDSTGIWWQTERNYIFKKNQKHKFWPCLTFIFSSVSILEQMLSLLDAR